MAKQQDKPVTVVDMTTERMKEIEERGYDIVPLSVLRTPPAEVYPRLEVDTDVVEQYRENWESYENSPIEAELSEGFILDGMHRYTACKEIGEIEAKAKNEEFDLSKCTIRVVWVRTPTSAADFLLDGAMRNAKHGLSLNNDDRKKCAIWLNRNGRPRRGITEWQEQIAEKLGVSSRTLREWINTDVADEKAEREAKIRELWTKNDNLPKDSKDKLSITQIAEIVGTTKNVVRGVRQKMLKERQAKPEQPKTAPGVIDGSLDAESDVKKGPVDMQGLDEPGILDRENAIYDSSEPRVQRAAMMALEEDQADSVYHDWCVTVALPDTDNVREIDKSVEQHPDNDALKEVQKELDDKAKAAWDFIERLCLARQALKGSGHFQKWVARQARALKREMTVEETIAGGQNPYQAQRVHTAMQNAPLGDEVERLGGGDETKFAIFDNPLASDSVVVGPNDRTKHLRYFYPVIGKDGKDVMAKARVMLDGFTNNPQLYKDYVDTVVNKPLPNLLRGDDPGANWMPDRGGPGGGGGLSGATPRAPGLDPKAGEVGRGSAKPMTVDETFQHLDTTFGVYGGPAGQPGRYARSRLKNLVTAHIMYLTERDDSLGLDELYEVYTGVFNELLDVELEGGEDAQQDAIENAGEEQEIGAEDVGSAEELGIF